MTSKETFKELELHPGILKAIVDCGYTTPTPIQKKAIPAILTNSDLCASANTGTGKTAAFLLPALHKVATSEKKSKHPSILIVVPTRELAIQIESETRKYCKHLKIYSVCIYGGVPYPVQRRNLSRPYDILIATPGRLIDHVENGRIKLSQVKMLILDEADRMLDMGFIDPVTQIADATPKKRQTLMFSATLNKTVLKLADHLLDSKNTNVIQIEPEYTSHKNITQKMHTVKNLQNKREILEDLLQDVSINKALIFTATKMHADELAEELSEQGHFVAPLHGDIRQEKRTRTIKQFRNGKLRILVATDVAARGINIPTVSHVINFDLPRTLDDYIHRIGRTGRADAKGLAISLASHKDIKIVKEIESFTGQKMSTLTAEKQKPNTKRKRNFKKAYNKPRKNTFSKRRK